MAKYAWKKHSRRQYLLIDTETGRIDAEVYSSREQIGWSCEKHSSSIPRVSGQFTTAEYAMRAQNKTIEEDVK